jgi:hypothetical protein
MRKLIWVAFSTAALAFTGGVSRAEEPALPETTLPSVGVAVPVPGEPVITDAAVGAHCPTCGDAMCGGDCSNCGKRQKRCARFLDWLIYIPLDHGKTKCCSCCDSCPPPAWAFFPCTSSGRCTSCAAAHATLYYSKEAGTANSNQVVETAYPPAKQQAAQAKPAAENQNRMSSYKPQSIAQSMPVLDPNQFRKAAGNN